jgi:hypothetical protein
VLLEELHQAGDDKVCGCPEGKSRCNDRCVNLKRNENHCGSCSNRCDEGEQCLRGERQGGECPGGTETEGDCTCAITCGADGSQFTCLEENPNCKCNLTIEGFGFCAAPGPGFGECPAECSSSDECAEANPGSKCVVSTCCDHPICAAPCCRRIDSICSADSECCSGLCDGETCVCIPDCQPCTVDGQCCSGICNGSPALAKRRGQEGVYKCMLGVMSGIEAASWHNATFGERSFWALLGDKEKGRGL